MGRGTSRAFLGAIVVVFAIVAGIGASLGAVGGVGGPPTLDFPRCDRFLRPCGPAIVLGRPRHVVGPVEVIGMHYERHGGGLCLFIDTLRTRSGHGACGPGSPLPSGGNAIQQAGIGVFSYRKRPVTQIDGRLAPDVTRVQARYWRHGELQHRKVAVIQVDGELLEKINEEQPFGIFELTVRGCFYKNRMRLLAFAGGDAPAQTIRTFRVPARCRHGGSAVILERSAGDRALRYHAR